PVYPFSNKKLQLPDNRVAKWIGLVAGPALLNRAQQRQKGKNIMAVTAAQTASPGQLDLQALKARQQGAWSSGDYAVVGTTLQIVGEQLCEALDIRAGQKV